MRCFESARDISRPKTQKIQVHILKNVDQYQYGVCFKFDKRCCIFVYTTKDDRGPVSSLVPALIKEGKIIWTDEGVIRVIDELEEGDWSSSSYLFNINKTTFESYQEWLLKWIKKHTKYSIIDTNNTVRTFLSHSIKYLSQDKKMRSVVLPDVHTYKLSFKRKERCSAIDSREMLEWYQNLLNEDDTILIPLIAGLNSKGIIYYRERVSSSDKYWILEGVFFESYYEKLKIESNDTPEERPVVVVDVPIKAQTIQALPFFAPQNPLIPIVCPANITPAGDNSMLVIIFLIAIFIIMIIVIALFLSSRSTDVVAAPIVVSTTQSKVVTGKTPVVRSV